MDVLGRPVSAKRGLTSCTVWGSACSVRGRSTGARPRRKSARRSKMYGPPLLCKRFRIDGLTRPASKYPVCSRSRRLLATMGMRASLSSQNSRPVWRPFFEPGFQVAGSTVRPSWRSHQPSIWTTRTVFAPHPPPCQVPPMAPGRAGLSPTGGSYASNLTVADMRWDDASKLTPINRLTPRQSDKAPARPWSV